MRLPCRQGQCGGGFGGPPWAIGRGCGDAITNSPLFAIPCGKATFRLRGPNAACVAFPAATPTRVGCQGRHRTSTHTSTVQGNTVPRARRPPPAARHLHISGFESQADALDRAAATAPGPARRRTASVGKPASPRSPKTSRAAWKFAHTERRLIHRSAPITCTRNPARKRPRRRRPPNRALQGRSDVSVRIHLVRPRRGPSVGSSRDNRTARTWAFREMECAMH